METTKTVYVGGFSHQTNAAALHTAFTPFGEIIDLQVPPDPSHQAPHRGFAFVSYSSIASALDAVDNMHRNVLPGPGNAGRVLKVNIAKPPKGITTGGSNRAIWTDEAWIAENGTAAVGEFAVGTEGGASGMV